MLFGISITELMALVKDPSKVAQTFAKIAPISLHTIGRHRLYEELAVQAAILARNSHSMLANALLRKTEISAAELEPLAHAEMLFLQLASRLNEYRKIPAEGFHLGYLETVYGIAPASGPLRAGAQAGDEGTAANGNGHAGAA